MESGGGCTMCQSDEYFIDALVPPPLPPSTFSIKMIAQRVLASKPNGPLLVNNKLFLSLHSSSESPSHIHTQRKWQERRPT